ncbi:MAG: hypothetical protein AAF741_04390 [Bacteroidota bacterium]
MKQILFTSVMMLFFCTSAGGQHLDSPDIYASKSELVDQFDLDDEQATQLDRILTQRHTNLDKLGEYTAQNEDAYWNKRRNFYYGELASIRLILKNRDQIEVYEAELRANRRAETERVRELVAEGNTPEAARLLMLRRY